MNPWEKYQGQQGPWSKYSNFLPQAQQVEQQIASRPDSMQVLGEEMGYNPNPFQHPIDYMMKPATTLMKAANVPMSRLESTVANAGLAAQRGEPGQMLPEAIQGLTGQRQGQLGDIIRTTGFGGRLNEAIAGTTGVLGMAGVAQGAMSGFGKISKLASKNLSRLPDKIFRQGVSAEEAGRIKTQYGNSNASLVDRIKNLLGNKRVEADTAYAKAMANPPKNFGGTIDVRATLRKMKNVFKGSLGEATRGQQGNRLYQMMQELQSRVPLPKGAGTQPNTPTQIIRQYRGEKLTDIAGEVRLNIKQFAELRDALNNLYRENPYDRNIAKVMGQLYSDGEKSGLTGLQKARTLQRIAFKNERLFLNRNTGDLKIATETKLSRIGTKNPLSGQELKHIADLQKYVNHPIIQDAAKINSLNRSAEILEKIKANLGWGVGGLVAGSWVTNKILKRINP